MANFGDEQPPQNIDEGDEESDDSDLDGDRVDFIEFNALVRFSDGEEDEDEFLDAEDGEPTEEKSTTAPSPEDICYDKSLPGAHSYLGDDLEEIHGRIIHEDESYIDRLPILTLPNVVLVPGQTLPLHLFQPSAVAMMMHVVQNERTFGLVTTSYNRQTYTPTMSSIGTTAEVLAFKEENAEDAGISTLRVKAIGRQRFEIKDSRRQADGMLRAKVLILPEHDLPSPLEGATFSSQQRLTAFQDQPISEAVMASNDKTALLKAWLQGNKSYRVKRLSSANCTWWPPWVYKQYDQQFLMKKIKEELQSWNETLNVNLLPTNASDLSFWVAGNLPLDDRLKLMLLGINNTTQRLRCELSIMCRYTLLCCEQCDLEMAEKKDMFSMAAEGPLGAYVNPGGHVHETITLYKAHGIRLIGRPSTENSWFPGYAWTIAQCSNCSQHMGWKFTATSKKHKPQMFWGLCRSSLKPGMLRQEHSADNGADDELHWRPVL